MDVLATIDGKEAQFQHLFNNTLKTDLADICLSKESGNAIYLTSSMTRFAIVK